MYTTATLYQLQRYLGVQAGADDDRLLAALRAASAQVERLAQRHFLPNVATRYLDIHASRQVILPDDLLDLLAVSDGGGDIPLAEIVTVPQAPPHSILERIDNAPFTTPQGAVSVRGVWGWHDDPINAWRGSGDMVLATLDGTANTITIGDAAGLDETGAAPRFQVGQMLRLEDEYLYLTGITINPSGADELQVMRGVAGTTAAPHPLLTMIEVFHPAVEVNALVLRWAAWLYKAPDRPLEDPPEDLLRDVESLRRISL